MYINGQVDSVTYIGEHTLTLLSVDTWW